MILTHCSDPRAVVDRYYNSNDLFWRIGSANVLNKPEKRAERDGLFTEHLWLVVANSLGHIGEQHRK